MKKDSSPRDLKRLGAWHDAAADHLDYTPSMAATAPERMPVRWSGRRRTALRVLLLVLSADALAKGCLLFLGGSWAIMRFVPGVRPQDISTLLLMTSRKAGIFDLAFSVMLFIASRTPEHNAAVLAGVIVGLCLAAVTDVLALRTPGATYLFSAGATWSHSTVQVAVAALIYCLRPRQKGGLHIT